MPKFAFKARDAAGNPIKGVIEAPTAQAAAGLVAVNGALPLEVVEQHEQVDIGAQIEDALGLGYPKRVELIMLTRQMYALTKAGVPITQSLRKLAETARNRRLVNALQAVADELETGRDLGSSLARHPRIFNPLFVAMIRVGEESGRLDEAFMRLNQHLEREQGTVEQIKTAMRYPTLVFGAIVIAVFILMAMVIPEFARVFASFKLELPLPTRILIASSQFVKAWWWLIALVMVGGGLGFRQWIRTERGQLWWHGFILKVPVTGSIVLRATLARFARAFSMATRSGVPILQALTVVSLAVDNDVVGQKLVSMRSAIERGESLTRAATAQNVFTPLVLQMLAVGDETGQVDEMLEEVASFYEREVDYDVRNLNDLLQPLMTAIMAALVLVLAMGVFLPMWDLTKLAGR